MQIGQRYTLKEFVIWMRRDSYWVLSVVGIPCAQAFNALMSQRELSTRSNVIV